MNACGDRRRGTAFPGVLLEEMAIGRVLTLATANDHKAREMASILAGYGWEIAPAPAGVAEAPETGDTFAENARIKARAVAAAVGGVALADDSGLAVDALHGEPGVRSRRWAGERATDADRVALLLEALRGVAPERRTARFICAVCIAAPDRVLWEGSGTVEGIITEAPRGANGFGYDPVFEVCGTGRTMAEWTPEEKNAASHRGRALMLARDWMRRAGAEHGS